MANRRHTFTTTTPHLWQWQTLLINHWSLPVQAQARPHNLSQQQDPGSHYQSTTAGYWEETYLPFQVFHNSGVSSHDDGYDYFISTRRRLKNICEKSLKIQCSWASSNRPVSCLRTSALESYFFLLKCRFQDLSFVTSSGLWTLVNRNW